MRLLRPAAAAQLVLEELLLTDVHLHPYELLAYEGAFGTLFMMCVCLPLAMIIPGENPPRCCLLF